MKKVTVIGGGTGSYVVLSGLKKFDIDLGVIVTMADSGGSTGKLRDQLGVLPPGDLRQCLLALSEASDLWRKLFIYRFENGDLKGHNFGNIFLAALEKVSDNYDQAIETASYVLKTKGQVIPMTLNQTHLLANYENGKIVKGESLIDENHIERSKIKSIKLEPAVSANPKAVERIKQSDYIIISPGDLYTSIIPIMLVSEIRDAIKMSKAKLLYFVNLMTKTGQTTDYKASDHVADIEKYLGRLPDTVLINNTQINKEVLQSYQAYDEKPVINDLIDDNRFSVITTDLIDDNNHQKNTQDVLYRSILRHHSSKVAQVLLQLFK